MQNFIHLKLQICVQESFAVFAPVMCPTVYLNFGIAEEFNEEKNPKKPVKI